MDRYPHRWHRMVCWWQVACAKQYGEVLAYCCRIGCVNLHLNQIIHPQQNLQAAAPLPAVQQTLKQCNILYSTCHSTAERMHGQG